MTIGKNRIRLYTLVTFLFLLYLLLFYSLSLKNEIPVYTTNTNNSSISTYNTHVFHIKSIYYPYQFEGNSSHVYAINGSVDYFNVSLKEFDNKKCVVFGSISYYRGGLLVPLSSSYMGLNFSEYFGGVVYINGTNGKQEWTDYFSNQIMTQPLVFGDIAYLGLGSAFFDPGKNANGILAVNITNGRVIWSRYLDSEHMPTFLYYNDTLLVAPGLGNSSSKSNGLLYFLNASTGKTIKRINLSSESAMSSILIVNNTAYFGAAVFNLSAKPLTYNNFFKDVFYAVNLTNKSIQWEDKFNSSLGMQDSSPVFSDGLIATGYTSSLNNATINILGLNYTNGKIIWNFTAPEYGNYTSKDIQLPPLTSFNDTVYSDSPTVGMLYAINASTGKLLWQFYTGPTSANVNVINNSLAILNSAGYLFVINLNGKLINEKYTGIGSGPENIARIGNKIVIYGDSDNIEALPIQYLFN